MSTDEHESMAVSDPSTTCKEIRRRLKRFRNILSKVDRATTGRKRDRLLTKVDLAIRTLLPDLPRTTGDCPVKVEQVRQDGHQLIQQARGKLLTCRKVLAETSGKDLGPESPSDAKCKQSTITNKEAIPGKRQRSKSQEQVQEDDHSGQGTRRKLVSRQEDGGGDENNYIITKVRLSRSEVERAAIEEGMTKVDESCWYDPSMDFDENMLP